MNETEQSVELWTAWLDYGGTGEGSTRMALVTYASSADEIRQHFESKFGDWIQLGCECQPGLVRNAVTGSLWSEGAFRDMERVGRLRGQLVAFASVHFNLG